MTPLVLASVYLMYNSWSLSDLNIRDDRVNFEEMLMVLNGQLSRHC